MSRDTVRPAVGSPRALVLLGSALLTLCSGCRSDRCEQAADNLFAMSSEVGSAFGAIHQAFAGKKADREELKRKQRERYLEDRPGIVERCRQELKNDPAVKSVVNCAAAADRFYDLNRCITEKELPLLEKAFGFKLRRED